MWKTFTWIGLSCAAFQWLLFGLNYYANGHINLFILPQAIGWTLWGLFCLYKYRKELSNG